MLPGSIPAPNDILEIAKANLREYFSLVGISERFDESLILLKRVLGWRTKDILYVRQNVIRDRPSKGSIDSDILKVIEQHNELDIQLYEFAKQMFEERISQQDSSFRREVQIFRLCNKLYSLFMNNKGVVLILALVRGDLTISYVYSRVSGIVKAATRKQR